MDLVHNNTAALVESRTLSWVKRVVVGLNLCPFANAVIKTNDLSLRTESSDDVARVLETLVDQCDATRQRSVQATSLLVIPNGFEDFDHYLDLVELAQALLEDLALDGILQLATFHPHYQFNDSEYDDAANYTNRSPYPMLHILQEAAVEQAIEQHPDVDAIPQRNIQRLREMDARELNQLLSEPDSI